jgi:hypothetical protein
MATTRFVTLAKAVGSLVGRQVLWVISDPESGSLIDFDPPRRHLRPINNLNLTHEQQNFKGDAAVLVRCAWELRDLGGVVIGQYGLGSPAGELSPLDDLAGRRVTASELGDSMCLALSMEDGATLQVDPRTKSREFAAYIVYRQQETWSVFSDGRVETSP